MGMNFWRVISSRKSCRSFDATQPISDTAIRQLIESAIRAPSAGNIQPWHFYMVRERQIRSQLAQAALDQMFIADAPLVVVICANQRWSFSVYGSRGELYTIQDTAAATQNILLSATALGLGSCWVGAFDEFTVRELLFIGPSWLPIAIVPIGYPLGRSAKTLRRSFEEVTTFV